MLMRKNNNITLGNKLNVLHNRIFKRYVHYICLKYIINVFILKILYQNPYIDCLVYI